MPLPDLDLDTPEGRFWHRLTCKPRQWIWELGFRTAANMPSEDPLNMREDVRKSIRSYVLGGGELPIQEHIDAFCAWGQQVYWDQTFTQDGKEYMAWLVQSLKPVLAAFFKTPSAEVMNYKALPLMTRRLPDFRGLVPVQGVIVVEPHPAPSPGNDWVMNVYPLDLLGHPVRELC